MKEDMIRHICPKCGNLISQNSDLCTSCGHTYTDMSFWPPEPLAKQPKKSIEANGLFLTGNQWLDMMVGFLGGLSSFIALFTLVFNPYTANFVPYHDRNLQLLLAWLIAASIVSFLSFKFLRKYSVFMPLFLFGSSLLALPALFTLIIFWYL